MYDKLTKEKEIEVIDKITNLIVKNGMSSPAILFLETFKSLSWIGGNYALMFVEPFLPCYINEGNELINVLGNIENVKLLINRIEEVTESSNKEYEMKGKRKSIGLFSKLKQLIMRIGCFV